MAQPPRAPGELGPVPASKPTPVCGPGGYVSLMYGTTAIEHFCDPLNNCIGNLVCVFFFVALVKDGVTDNNLFFH